MKKILLLSENFPPIEGGSGRWFWELYSRLPADSVLVFAHNEPGSSEFDTHHTIPIVRGELRCEQWGLRSIKGLAFYWRTLKQLKTLVKQNNIEEIHCGRVIHEGVTAWLLSLLTGIPYRCFVHGEDVQTAATSREQAWMVKQVCRRASSLICNSFNSVNLVTSLGFSNEKKCHVLHPGADIKKFVPAAPDSRFRHAMGWDNRFVLLTVGRLQRRKGQDLLIEALPDLIKDHPNLLYVVIGSGDCEALLKNKIATLKLDHHVQLHTTLDDAKMIQCYQQCDLFILPNRTIENDIEGFGMVLVEAQACGKAAFAGDSGGTKEAISPKVTGEIIDCTSAAAIHQALTKVVNTNLVKQYESNARQFVERNFSWQVHVEKFNAHLTETPQ